MLFDSGHTLPPLRRIRKKAEFELALREKRTVNKWFVLNVRNNGSNTSRLGIAIGRRAMPKAVSRNYAKRLVREVFRRIVPAQCGVDVVVGFRRPITPHTATEGRQALMEQFLALRTRCEESSSG